MIKYSSFREFEWILAEENWALHIRLSIETMNLDSGLQLPTMLNLFSTNSPPTHTYIHDFHFNYYLVYYIFYNPPTFIFNDRPHLQDAPTVMMSQIAVYILRAYLQPAL